MVNLRVQGMPIMFSDICQNPNAMSVVVKTTLDNMKRLIDAMPEGHATRMELAGCVAVLATTFADWQLAVARNDFSVSLIDEAFDGVLSLLSYAEGQSIPAQDLSGLLALLHRQLRVHPRYSGVMQVAAGELERSFQSAPNAVNAAAA